MLLDQVNRHRRLVMTAILVFIGIPMLFFIPGAARFTMSPGKDSAIVAKVGSTPVYATDFYQQFTQAQEQRQRFGQPATAQDMVADGSVDGILDGLINQALIKERTKANPVHPDESFLQERLKDDPYFKNDQGEFDAGLYNQWVKNATRSKFDWDSFFGNMSDQINNDAFMFLAGASARVTNAEVREFFNDRNTKLKVRAIAVEPKVELTDEEVQAYYDEHKDEFMSPDERVAEYVAISMQPPVPPLVDEIIAKANGGEDFAELAKQYSEAFDADSGGDLGWISETAGLRDHEKVLFEMQPGEVRGPVRSFLGLHIFKVEEFRTDDQGNREVHARQILLRPQLDEAERAARIEKANAVRAAAMAGGAGLQVAAADAGLEIHRTGRFSIRTEEIEGISESDSFPFRRDASALEMGQISEVIQGTDNLYIVSIVELYPASERSFEDAKDDVRAAAGRERKQTPEYQQKVAEYVQKISQQTGSIADVQAKFPELPIEVKETTPFGMDDMLFSQGLFIDTRQIFGRLLAEDVGTFTGPYTDMLRVPHFIELVDKIIPEGETWDAQFETERTDIRKQLISTREVQQRVDYLQHALAKAIDDAQVQKDYDLVFEILGLKDAAKATQAGAPAAAPPAAAAPVPAPEGSTDAGTEADAPATTE